MPQDSTSTDENVHAFSMEGRRLSAYYSTGDALKAKHATATGASGVPFPDWAIGLLDLTETRRAIDAGCGWGRFATVLAGQLPEGSELICCDVFPGMVSSAREALADAAVPTRYLAADIEDMPFLPGLADLVMANHVLYHLRDFGSGVRSLGRLMAPGATLLATTNADDIRIPIIDAHNETLRRMGIHLETTAPSSFSLENGRAALEPHFATVEEHIFRDEKQSDVESLTQSYLNTGRYLTVAQNESLPAALREQVPEVYRSVAAEMAEPDGTIRLPILMVAYLCQGPVGV